LIFFFLFYFVIFNHDGLSVIFGIRYGIEKAVCIGRRALMAMTSWGVLILFEHMILRFFHCCTVDELNEFSGYSKTEQMFEASCAIRLMELMQFLTTS